MAHPLNISDALFDSSVGARAAQLAGFAPLLAAAEVDEAEAVGELRGRGYTLLRGLLAPEVVASVRAGVDRLSAAGRGLLAPRRVEPDADPNDYEAMPRLTAEEVARGEDYMRRHASMVQIADPLMTFPELLTVALHRRILGIVGCYLGCWPALTYAKMRKSFANGLPRCDTELFHVDGNSTKMCKALLFLTDSDDDPDAAHEFVLGSHNGATAGIDPFARFERDRVVADWGAERMRLLTCKAGDVVIEDTTGMHTAGKPRHHDRTIALFNYGVHAEYGGGGAVLRIPGAPLRTMAPEQVAATEFLTVV
ncbi:MAG: phytanoyl-CoA dioxygenase family protein [Alphaproteobacteria bacterium]